MSTIQCPSCGAKFDGFASRNTNNGHKNCRDLVHWLNTATVYEAVSEPTASPSRTSGVRMRPDIKIRRRDALPGGECIFVERQEQNTTGTGCDKIANKIHKALAVLNGPGVSRYYIVVAGKRLDLLQKIAIDTLARGGVYPDSRLSVVTEDEFKTRAQQGRLEDRR